MLRTATVGRPRKPPAKPEALPPKTIGFRVSGEFGVWLEGAADHFRTTTAGVLERAIVEWCESQGYKAKAPRRMP